MPVTSASLRIGSAVLLIAACAAPAGSPPVSPTPIAAPTAAVTSPSFDPATTTPSPSPMPSPSPSASPAGSAELVLRFQACDLGCGVDPGLIVLTDGRLLRRGEDGMTVRQLTPDGLQLIRDAVAATGLFDADATYEPKLRPRMESGGFGPMTYLFQVAGADMVAVRSVDPEPFDADNHRVPGTWSIPPEVYALDELASRLEDLDRWLRPEAWAGPAEAFEPERYLLIVTVDRDDDPAGGRDADDVRWPFATRIDAVGAPLVDAADPNADPTRCLVIARDEARALAAAEGADEDGFPYRSLRHPFDSLMYPLQRAGATVSVATRIVLPYQEPTCEGASRW